MKSKILIIYFAITSLAFAQNPNISLVDAFSNLSFVSPLHLIHCGDATNRIFLVQQNGLIKVFLNDSNISASSVKTFLDVSNKISSSVGEEGLLGLAFHPNYSSNGYFYVNYTTPNPLRTVISRFKVTPGNPDKADSLSEYKILEINQPYSNHNGGTIMFGLDGFLYIGMGDGGNGGDPQNYAQNLQSLLGKFLRINVNDTTATKRYTIPSSNPFYGNPAAGLEEIYAWGMRNPWKFSQDNTTGLIYAADVGQNIWEEIDIIQSGRNYGWRVMEGFVCYNPPSGCDSTGKSLPIKVYNHSGGDCSVTGGYVYRGNRRPELRGAYIYADYCSGKIWMLRYNGITVTSDSLLIDSPYLIGSFGIDKNNELYILNTASSGKIYRFNKSSSVNITLQTGEVKNYQLYQNYPNPFNPVTKIKFDIPIFPLSKGGDGVVSLRIFDVTGREVAALVNQQLAPGTYSVDFDGTNFASGIYFYRLKTGDFENVKRLILLK